jgi:hypothetical protein
MGLSPDEAYSELLERTRSLQFVLPHLAGRATCGVRRVTDKNFHNQDDKKPLQLLLRIAARFVNGQYIDNF